MPAARPGTMEYSWCSAGWPKSARAAGVPPLFFAAPASSLPESLPDWWADVVVTPLRRTWDTIRTLLGW